MPSPDTIPEESHSDVASFSSSGIPADLPKSPAIFNEEFAAQAPNPAPVGRPELDEMKDDIDQRMWTPKPSSSDQEGEAVVPISSSYSSGNAGLSNY